MKAEGIKSSKALRHNVCIKISKTHLNIIKIKHTSRKIKIIKYLINQT